MNRTQLILKCLKQCLYCPYVQGFTRAEHEEIRRLVTEIEVADMANDYIDVDFVEIKDVKLLELKVD